MPVLAAHRRNDPRSLAGLPRGCWTEIDLDVHRGKVVLTHDPMDGVQADAIDAAISDLKAGRVPSSRPGADRPAFLEEFLVEAGKAAVAGLILDCKRENVEKLAKPILAASWRGKRFWLNEMEIQAEIFLEADSSHGACMRVWGGRGAQDVIDEARRAASQGRAGPSWIWMDCWSRGLTEDIQKARIPLAAREAGELRALGVGICVCSPELYVHRYGVDYSEAEIEGFRAGVESYRAAMEQEGMRVDMICTKFPKWWGLGG